MLLVGHLLLVGSGTLLCDRFGLTRTFALNAKLSYIHASDHLAEVRHFALC